MKLNIGIPEENILTFASINLTDKAFKFWSELQDIPTNWEDFVKSLNNRFGTITLDKTALYLKIFSNKQKENEKNKNFIQEIYKLGEKAQMEEKLLVQTIIDHL